MPPGVPVKSTVTLHYDDGRTEVFEVRLNSIAVTQNFGSRERFKLEGEIVSAVGVNADGQISPRQDTFNPWIPASNPSYGPVLQALGAEPEKPRELPATAADLLRTLGQ